MKTGRTLNEQGVQLRLLDAAGCSGVPIRILIGTCLSSTSHFSVLECPRELRQAERGL